MKITHDEASTILSRMAVPDDVQGCDVLLMADYIAQQEAYQVSTEKELADLRKGIGELPTDKNGTPLANGMIVRLPCGHKTDPVNIVSKRHFCILGECCHTMIGGSRTGKWYSDNQCTVEATLSQSEKAAEAAEGHG